MKYAAPPKKIDIKGLLYMLFFSTVSLRISSILYTSIHTEGACKQLLWVLIAFYFESQITGYGIFKQLCIKIRSQSVPKNTKRQ